MPAAGAERLVLVERWSRVTSKRLGILEALGIAIGGDVPEQDARRPRGSVASPTSTSRGGGRPMNPNAGSSAGPPRRRWGSAWDRRSASARCSGSLDQRPHRRAGRSRGSSRCRRPASSRKNVAISYGSSRSPFDLGGHERGDQVVLVAALARDAGGFDVVRRRPSNSSCVEPQVLRTSGSSKAVTTLVQWTSFTSSFSGVPSSEPITRAGIGRATSMARSQLSRSAKRSRIVLTIRRTASSCSAMRFGVNALPTSLLEAVVARRVHRDHLQSLHVERDADVVDQEDPALLGGERLEVARRAMDVLGPQQGPEARLRRDSVGCGLKCTGSSRRRRAKSLVGRPVGPQRVVAEIDGHRPGSSAPSAPWPARAARAAPCGRGRGVGHHRDGLRHAAGHGVGGVVGRRWTPSRARRRRGCPRGPA